MCCVFYERVTTDSEYCLPVSGTKWIAHIPPVLQHTLSCSGYHFRYVFILKMLFIPPSYIHKHMHSLLSPHVSPLSHFPESCITCKHDGVTSSYFKISWHFTLPAVWVKSAEVTVAGVKAFVQCGKIGRRNKELSKQWTNERANETTN